jgi:DNA (cytosine-5)-methyltransferase 1
MERSKAGLLTHISLFAGMGCESIAANWAGFKTILHCEIDPDCQKVLKHYWPSVPIIEDVRNVTRESVIANATIMSNGRHNRESIDGQIQQPGISIKQKFTTNTDIIRCDGQQVEQRETQTGRRWFRENHQLTLLSAGCPCQPASEAGKRRGQKDDRWLWPEAIRVLDELQPTWGVFENPVGIGSLGEYGEILSMGDEAAQGISDTEAVELDRLCGQIEACGYEVQPVSIPACAVGAPHERQRIFIICHTSSCGLSGESRRRTGSKSQDGYLGDGQGINPDSKSLTAKRLSIGKEEANTRLDQYGEDATNSQESGLEGAITEGRERTGRCTPQYDREHWQSDWYSKAIELCQVKTKPGVRTLDDGTTNGLLGLSRTVKMKMIGNCNPPQLYYPIFKAIADIEANP